MAFETVEASVRGVPMRVWKHVPATAAEAFAAARRHGAREFLVHGDERVTYDGFARAALAVAALLRERGLKKGDRVALVMRNLPEWPVVFMGALLAGAIVVPLNAWWTGTELAYGLLDSGARFVFADAERLARLTGPAALGRACLCHPRRQSAARRHGAGRGDRRAGALAPAAGRRDAGCGACRRKTTPRSSTPPAPPARPRARWARTAR